jgi:hypothetical protein
VMIYVLLGSSILFSIKTFFYLNLH